MAFRKRTLRTMSPTARKVARLAGEIESAVTRLKNTLPELQQLDLDSRALSFARQQPEKLGRTQKEILVGLIDYYFGKIVEAEIPFISTMQEYQYDELVQIRDILESRD